MEDLSRSEYPAMLAHLTPNQASQTLNERVKRILRTNTEIADWLQERRKVEEQYIAGLGKLALFKVPNANSELGVFQPPWDRVLHSIESIAASHQLYVSRIEKDVEHSLRGFQSRPEVAGMQTFVTNMQNMAKELDDSQTAADKANKKGGKKAEAANTRLETATQQWESQAPFIYESLQALDEQRTNHLRDLLTQLQTHEVDQASRTQASAEEALNMTLEVDTAQEIQSFASRTVAGKPKQERRAQMSRQTSAVASTTRPPSSAGGLSGHQDDATNSSEHSGGRLEPPTESKLRSRLGTMLGRRRQSIHGFGQLSPAKNAGPFSRGLSSAHGPRMSPRASMNNLSESGRLSSLAESPDSPRDGKAPETNGKTSHEGSTNGLKSKDEGSAAAHAGESGSTSKPALTNGEPTADDLFGPPPAASQADNETGNNVGGKDADGFTVPPEMNDPISQAQKEAAGDDHDQFFKLNIQKEPVAEEDADAQKAAISNVTNTLSMSMPSRKSGTIRGRRDVRNTIYMPPSAMPDAGSQLGTIPASPASPSLPTSVSKPSAVATLASEASVAAMSDTQSVRSSNSLNSLAHAKHPELTAPGLSSSIIETVSAHFEGGNLKTVKVNGEIAFAYNAGPDFIPKDRENIRIDNMPLLEAIGPNRIFVSNTGYSDEFTLDTSHMSKTATAFTYRLHCEPEDPSTLEPLCPLIVKPAWKPTQDHKIGLLLQYALNPAIFPSIDGAASSPTSETSSSLPQTITLRNLVFVATYEGRASAAQTKPAGTHLRDKHLVYWRLGDVTLTCGSEIEWSKIVCRIVGADGADIQPGHIEARWEYTPQASSSAPRISISRLLEDTKGKGKAVVEEDGTLSAGDPFSDDNPISPRNDDRKWAEVPLVRKAVSGKYEAK